MDPDYGYIQPHDRQSCLSLEEVSLVYVVDTGSFIKIM